MSIIYVTAPPRFYRRGSCLICELDSDPDTYRFSISKHDTQIALQECASTFLEWDNDAHNVVEFDPHPH